MHLARPLAGGGGNLVFNNRHCSFAWLPLSGKKSLASIKDQSRCKVAAVNHYDGQLAFAVWSISTVLLTNGSCCQKFSELSSGEIISSTI